jgi:hypothetical protein
LAGHVTAIASGGVADSPYNYNVRGRGAIAALPDDAKELS